VANLAIAMAELGHPTLVIDGEIRKPGMHHVFRVKPQPGLTDVLHGAAGHHPEPAGHQLPWREATVGAAGHSSHEHDRALQTSHNGFDIYLQKTFVPNLSVVASGGAPFDN